MSLNVTFLMPTALLVADDLEHAIDQQHRVAVRAGSAGSRGCPSPRRGATSASRLAGLLLLEQPPGEQVVQLVAALVRDEPPADRPADEVQVADQVQHLVPHALVGEAERVVDRARSGEMTSRSFGVRCLPRPRARSSCASCSKTNVRAGASCSTKSSSRRAGS